MSSTHRVVRVPSGELVVHEWGAPAPFALVLLAHGYAEHAGRYEHVARRLGDAGMAVVAPDQRGHGLSTGERGLMADLDGYADDLAAVAAHVAGEYSEFPTFLVGHSMGGNIAIRFVQRGYGADLRALVLSGPVAGGNPDVFALAEQDPIPNVPVDPEVLSRDLAVGERFAQDALVYHGAYLRGTLTAYQTSVQRIAASCPLGQLPTLWMHGELDELAPLAETRGALERIKGPYFDEVIYPGARHEIFNETNKTEVFDDLVRFLERWIDTT